MKRILYAATIALATAVAGTIYTAPAQALGQLPIQFPKPDRKGTVPTPAPVLGGGLIWLGAVVGGGVYMVIRRRRRN